MRIYRTTSLAQLKSHRYCYKQNIQIIFYHLYTKNVHSLEFIYAVINVLGRSINFFLSKLCPEGLSHAD